MLPAVPMEMTRAARVAKRRGPNQRVISLRLPMRLQAIPTPSRIRPTTSMVRESAQAKMRAPATATRESTVMVRRGPMWSRVDADGKLGQGKGVKKGRRHEAQAGGIEGQIGDQVGGDHGNRGPVELGEQKKRRGDDEDHPAAGNGHGHGVASNRILQFRYRAQNPIFSNRGG